MFQEHRISTQSMWKPQPRWILSSFILLLHKQHRGIFL
uniref:Uncharacterized protein n=1 Tax=Anguilla anguilla TaxID=7936 RepID=A0A0E9SL95_ANGAN